MSINVALAVMFAASVSLIGLFASYMVYDGRDDFADWLAVTVATLLSGITLIIWLMSACL